MTVLGLGTSLIVAHILRKRENKKKNKKKEWFDFISTEEAGRMLVLCGGRYGQEGMRAERIRINTFWEYLDASVATVGRPALVLVDNLALEAALYEHYHTADRVAFLGRDTSWQPFDPYYQYEEAMFVLEKCIQHEVGENRREMALLKNMVAMLLDILGSCHGNEGYFSFCNLNYLAQHLVRIPEGAYDNQYEYLGLNEFIDWAGEELGVNVSNFIRNQLILDWNEGIPVFYNFWSKFIREAARFMQGNGRNRSVASLMEQGRTCICRIENANNELVLTSLLAELRILRNRGRIAGGLIDYFVKLPKNSWAKDAFAVSSLGCQGRYCLIGGSMRELGIGREFVGSSSRLTVVCMGQGNAADAKELVNIMVPSVEVYKPHIGMGRGAVMGIGSTIDPAVTTSELMLGNIQDGQAYILDENGFRFVMNLLT